MAGLQPFSLANVLSNAANIQGARIDNKLRNLQLQQASDPNSLQNRLAQAELNRLNNLAQGGGAGFGLSPVYTMDDEGKVSAYQLSDTAGVGPRPVEFAPGQQVLTGPVNVIDTKTHREVRDRFTNELIARIPINNLDAALDTEAGKLQAQLDPAQGKAAVETAVVTAREEAQAQAEQKAQEKKNEKAANVYKQGMKNLYKGLSGAKMTGQLMGRMAPFTAPDQVADNAKAIMLPILKQAVRQKGEGVFTDKDAEAILALIPDRINNQAAIAPIMSNVNDYMSATFGIDIDLSELGIPIDGEVKTITNQTEYDSLPDGASYIYEGVEYIKGQ